MTAAEPRTPGAERARRHRQRERAGLKVFRVAVNHYAAVDRLIALGRLSEEAAADDGATARALEQLLADALQMKKRNA